MSEGSESSMRASSGSSSDSVPAADSMSSSLLLSMIALRKLAGWTCRSSTLGILFREPLLFLRCWEGEIMLEGFRIERGDVLPAAVVEPSSDENLRVARSSDFGVGPAAAAVFLGQPDTVLSGSTDTNFPASSATSLASSLILA